MLEIINADCITGCASPFGIFVVDDRGCFRSVNTAACTLTGFTAVELLTMYVPDLLPDAGVDHFRHLLNSGQSKGEMRYRTKSGVVRWWNISVVLTNTERFICFCEDITQRRAAEAEVAHLADLLTQTSRLARVGGWWIDLSDRSLHWSEVTREIHEVPVDYQPEITTSIAFYKEGESRARISAAVEACLRDGTPFDVEAQIITARGREVWVRAIGRLRSSPGRPTTVYGAFQDIDAAKLAQLDLQRSQAEAKAATEAKSIFLAKTSHELRTPIHGMLGLTDLLLLDDDDPKRRVMLEHLSRAGRMLRDLVNDALDHERLELGRVVIKRTVVDLRELLRHRDEQFQLLAQRRQIALCCVIAESVPAWVIGDPIRLRQILNNLIANALRFVPAGGRVSVEAAVCREGDRLRLVVADTGPGIAHAHKQAIFKPFVQIESLEPCTSGGTGLGLAICRQLVEAMGGTIGVDSTLGEGSRFWFEIPFEVAVAPDSSQKAGSESQADTERIGLRVLVADDDEVTRFTVARMLESLGCCYQVVGDGQAAVDAIAQAPFDVVLMDLQMPLLDGRGATQAIRRSGSHVPILLCSATTAAEDLTWVHDVGIDAHLVKPLSLNGLRHALRKIRPSN